MRIVRGRGSFFLSLSSTAQSLPIPEKKREKVLLPYTFGSIPFKLFVTVDFQFK